MSNRPATVRSRQRCRSRKAACACCCRAPGRNLPPPWVFAAEEHVMTDDLCPREAEVLRAGDTDEWTPELHAHLATCPACREVEAVTQVLRAAVDDEPVALATSADDIWWRAQLQARQDARANAM